MSDIDEPVHLIQRDDSGDRFLIYADAAGLRVELRHQGDALWMSQAQIASLFGRDVSVVSRHIANILEEGELAQEGNLQFVQFAQSTKPVSLYSLDMVISVGYRVSSTQATLFRRWATSVLVRFATKGFVVDVERLKTPDQQDRIAELRDIIRDIRSSEANVYAELRRICAMCRDYDPRSSAAHVFYQQMQAKLFYAVTNQIPSEILASRPDAEKDNMGLKSWAKSEVRKSDVIVAKNYLSEREIRELNRLTNILLDIFDDQLDIGHLTTMAEAEALLEDSLRQLRRLVLNHGGQISRERAERQASVEYARFDAVRKARRKSVADAELAALKAAGRSLPKDRKKPT